MILTTNRKIEFFVNPKSKDPKWFRDQDNIEYAEIIEDQNEELLNKNKDNVKNKIVQ